MILTSNPEDYIGVNRAPDALIDRVVTFALDDVSFDTECGIVAARSGLPPSEARRLVHLVRALREDLRPGFPISMRTGILIGRLIHAQSIPADTSDPRFLQVCTDVLRGRSGDAPADELVPRLLRHDGNWLASERAAE
jgi:MoxR-like ATPase